MHTLPTSWTDAGGVDRFVAVAAGGSLFRVAELIELAGQVEGLKVEGVGRGVKEKTPDCKGNVVKIGRRRGLGED